MSSYIWLKRPFLAVETVTVKTYRDCLKEMITWFFLRDHNTYSHLLPIHPKDLFDAELNVHHKFMIRKSIKPFSAIRIAQAHNQNNTIVK